MNTPKSLSLIDDLMSSMTYNPPGCFDVAFRIVEADASLVREWSMVREWSTNALTSEGHHAVWEALMGDGRIVGQCFITTKSGQRVSLTSGLQYPVDFEGSEDSNAQSPIETVGMEFELEPMLGPDGITFDADLSIGFDTSPPTLEFTGNKKRMRFFEETLLTSVVTLRGQNHLIGTWTPETSPSAEKRDVMHAAFLEVHATTIGGAGPGPIDEDE